MFVPLSLLELPHNMGITGNVDRKMRRQEGHRVRILPLVNQYIDSKSMANKCPKIRPL